MVYCFKKAGTAGTNLLLSLQKYPHVHVYIISTSPLFFSGELLRDREKQLQIECSSMLQL